LTLQSQKVVFAAGSKNKYTTLYTFWLEKQP